MIVTVRCALVCSHSVAWPLTCRHLILDIQVPGRPQLQGLPGWRRAHGRIALSTQRQLLRDNLRQCGATRYRHSLRASPQAVICPARNNGRTHWSR